VRLATTILLALAASACTTTVADGPAVITDGDSTALGAVTYQAPLAVPSERISYGVAHTFFVDRDDPSRFRHFDLLPGGKVDVDVAHEDGRRRVGMRVYRVNPTGTLRFLGEVVGRGSVVARVESRAGGTIVVEAFGTFPNRRSAGLELLVECARRDGRCAPNPQPGDLCGTRGAGDCDEGLYCQFSPEVECGRSDGGGTCAIPAQVCVDVWEPVCGCDGVTYSSACHASMAGVSVEFSGECAPVCDPSQYEFVKEDQLHVSIHGTWVWHGHVDGFWDVESRLRLNDGDFSYEQVWNPTCLHADPPCRVASRFFSMVGGWEQPTPTSVQLLPEAEPAPPEELAQAFTVVENCEGDLRLRTTELGHERDFIHDRCADIECDEGEQCIVEPVMCIRAPCPPMPRCIPAE
jgi:hypothetical protein